MIVNDVDVRIGERIRALRQRAGLSQKDLAQRLDIVFQQLQKHETGSSRVPASRLYDIARVLDTPISYFFDPSERTPPKPKDGLAPLLANGKGKMAQQVLALVRAFVKITDDSTRANIVSLVTNLSRPKKR